MKTALKVFMIIAVVGYLLFAVATLSHSNSNNVCAGVTVIINDTSQTPYMGEDYVKGILTTRKISPEGRKISHINLHGIEKQVKSNPYMDSVICYFTPTDVLCVKVIPCKPVLHIMTNNGEDYYMDDSGKVLPADDFNLDLCLATGNVSKAMARTSLLELAKFLNTQSPWDKEIQQVHVIDRSHLILIPVTGSHRIMLGPPTDLEAKFEKLKVFYKEGLDKVGWNKYSMVDLSFANQVVCSRKNHKE